MPQFYRKLNYTDKQEKFNNDILECNQELKLLCKNGGDSMFKHHPLRNMFHMWESLLTRDGVHSNEQGHLKLRQNNRRALKQFQCIMIIYLIG